MFKLDKGSGTPEEPLYTAYDDMCTLLRDTITDFEKRMKYTPRDWKRFFNILKKQSMRNKDCNEEDYGQLNKNLVFTLT